MTYILTKIFRMFLIGTIALWGWPEVADLLGGIKDGFVGAGTMASVLETALLTPLTNLYDGLYTWAGDVLSTAATGFAILNLVKVGLVLFFILVLFLAFGLFALFVGFISAISLAMFLVANCTFILLLAVGPFFLLCLAFPFTQRFFETFIGNVMTAILAMGFTVLMINFVSSLFSFAAAGVLFVPAADSNAAIANIKSVAIYFTAMAGKTLLIIYMYYKVFDLAAALGGGLNMGNNMIGAARNITRDALGTGGGRGGTSRTTNQINQGAGAAGGGSPARSSAMDAIRANRTFTGMGISGAAAGVRAVGRAAAASARGTAAAGKFAYNRYSQARGGNSISG